MLAGFSCLYTRLGSAGPSMSLPAAYVAALAMQCAPLVAPETLVSIAQTESRLEPLAIHDNTTGKAYMPATIEVASTQAEGLIRAGHSVDLGLMQINSANLHLAGLSVRQSFEACYALAAGARLLAKGYSGGVTVDEQQRALLIALSRYNTGDPLRGFENGYVGRVESAARQVVPAIHVPEPSPKLEESRNIAAELRILRAFSGYATGSPDRGFALKPPGQSVSYVESMADTKDRSADYRLPASAASPQQRVSAKLISLSTK
jgi:hypothetical protein